MAAASSYFLFIESALAAAEGDFITVGERYTIVLGDQSLITKSILIPAYPVEQQFKLRAHYNVLASSDSAETPTYNEIIDDELDRASNLIFSSVHTTSTTTNGYKYETNGRIPNFFDINVKVYGNRTDSTGAKDDKITIETTFTALRDLTNIKIGHFYNFDSDDVSGVSKTHRESENHNFICSHRGFSSASGASHYGAAGIYVRPSSSSLYKTFAGYEVYKQDFSVSDIDIGTATTDTGDYLSCACILGPDSDPATKTATSFSLNSGQSATISVDMYSAPAGFGSSVSAVDDVGDHLMGYTPPPTPTPTPTPSSYLSIKQAIKLWFDILKSSHCPTTSATATSIWRQVHTRAANHKKLRIDENFFLLKNKLKPLSQNNFVMTKSKKNKVKKPLAFVKKKKLLKNFEVVEM
ncbi:hypothetical protein HYD_0850 [Candidatus Hydrogenosomobacter endosymbioticus]|uniref:Uncharacterized protein n=2 Tax=Candidatus Hydrogenosomobacter endosymbioticus TaxID=2558174 RepID=A0ABM7V858_9PROT|nr:hypothetical protein HYD_0850 [Candidatus Hydrogenosomobacter endosymbioticus]